MRGEQSSKAIVLRVAFAESSTAINLREPPVAVTLLSKRCCWGRTHEWTSQGLQSGQGSQFANGCVAISMVTQHRIEDRVTTMPYHLRTNIGAVELHRQNFCCSRLPSLSDRYKLQFLCGECIPSTGWNFYVKEREPFITDRTPIWGSQM